MEILVSDLDEDGAGFVEEVAGEEEAIAEICKIGMDAELPGISESAYHFRFLSKILVFPVLNVAAIDEGLEIRPVTDSVGWVDVDHLDLAGHAFFFEQGVHHEERIAGDEAIGPAVGVAVEIDGFAEWGIFSARLEEIALRGLERDAVAFANGFDDGARINAFVDVEGDRGNFKGSVLFFPSPNELWIEMRIVSVCLSSCDGRFSFRRDESDRR